MNARTLFWIWIIGATMGLLLYAPITVTKRVHISGGPVTTTETKWIGPFGKNGSFETKSSVDLSRLLVAFLLINGLPILALWKLPEDKLNKLLV